MDVQHKFIRRYEVTAANVHDSRVFEELLRENTSRDVYADSACFSEESRERLTALGCRPRNQRKEQKNQPLSAWESKGIERAVASAAVLSMCLGRNCDGRARFWFVASAWRGRGRR